MTDAFAPGWICLWKTPRGDCKVRIVETGKEHWGNQSLCVDEEGRLCVATNMDLTMMEKKDPPIVVSNRPPVPLRVNLLGDIQGDEAIRRYTHV